MHFFGPERKYLANGSRPLLAVGMSVLPNLSIIPISENIFRISIMLPTRSNACGWHEHDCIIDELPAIFARYISDPEDLFKTVFGWSGQGFNSIELDFNTPAEKVAKATAQRSFKPAFEVVSVDDIESDIF